MTKKFFFCAFLLFEQIFLLKAQQNVTFKTAKIPTEKVSVVHLFLAGNFNNWNPADTAWQMQAGGAGSYRLTKDLPEGVYQFKVTRGSWQSVECTAQGQPVDNRNLTIRQDTTIIIDISGWQDDFAKVEKVHTASPQVHIISDSFNMPQLGRQRRIWIYLPKDYGSSKTKYPVIYMNDGQNLFDAYTSGYGEWGIDEILDKVPDKKECIVVGIDHGGENRITEYDPYDSSYGKGRGDDYSDFLAKTLKPYVDAHYRTKSDAQHTTIAGSSMGGLISMYAALRYPGIFGSAGIFSPAFWIAPQIYHFVQQVKLPAYTRFYFVCGDAESDSMVTDMKKMADILISKEKNKENTAVTIVRGAGHNEKQWNGDFPGFYEWLMGAF